MNAVPEKSTYIHPFEKAELGKAPFRCVGVSREIYQAIPGDSSCPIQPGTCCDYCGQAIYDAYQIKSADGRRFKVGCDCVAKLAKASNATLRDDPMAKLAREVRREKNKLNRAKAGIKADAVKADLEMLLADTAVRVQLAARLHPRGFVDRIIGAPLTDLDDCEWMFKHAGAAGRARLLKYIKGVIKQ